MKYFALCVFFVICISFLHAQPEFSSRVDLGEIENTELVEASGLVSSTFNQHVLWSHNDTYNFNRIFAFNELGTHLAIYWLDGIENRDWEGMAVGPGPEDDIEYLYIGEIGDNNSAHNEKYIYRIQEPAVDFSQNPVEETIYDIDTIIYQYPDGNRDAETLMLDPLTKDIYVVSKREADYIRVYRAPYPQPLNQLFTLELVNSLQLTQLVGGDISVDGTEILLKNYEEIYYWERDPGEDLWEAFNEDPVILPYLQETQGEAICWAEDSMGYFTLSEEALGIETHLYYYPRIDASPLVINEVMIDPLAVDDALGEWIEIYNNSGETLDLQNWILQDAGSDMHTITESLILSPGEFLVLGAENNETMNGGANVDYQYLNFSLDNAEDEIIIQSPTGNFTDSVVYSDNLLFPITEGASMALLDPNMENSCGFDWRTATSAYGNGDLGTPGFANSGAVPTVSIREIQYTEDPTGHSDYTGQRVQVSGTLSVEPYSFGNSRFFLQDSLGMWSGILVHYTSYASDQDSVRLTGTVEEAWGDFTVLTDIDNFENFGPASINIDSIIVSTEEISTLGQNGEAYEGVLIKVNGICINENIGWREWTIDDGSGSTRVFHSLIDDFEPIPGEDYEVTGIQLFYDNEFKIFPRFISDIIGPSGIDEETLDKPHSKLAQNFPNPFNPFTTFMFSLQIDSNVELLIFNIKGQKIKTATNNEFTQGSHSIEWNGKDESNKSVGSGIYFYKLIVNGRTEAAKKCLLLK